VKVEELIEGLKHADIRLHVENGRLRVSAPKGALTRELQESIGSLKAQLIALLDPANREEAPPFKPLERIGPIPLSFAQERLWFLHKLQPENTGYHVAASIMLDKAVDLGALNSAVDLIVERHEVLRSSFPEEEGTPRQVVHARISSDTEVIDAEYASSDIQGSFFNRLEEFARRPFDIAGGPLFRTHLFRLNHDQAVLLVVMHHIISDTGSLHIFVREFQSAYKSLTEGSTPRLPSLPVQFSDYAYWQRNEISSRRLEAQATHWKERLATAPTILELPTDRPRSAAISSEGSSYSFALDKATSYQLKELCAKENVTVYMLMLAVFNAFLFRYTRQQSILVGTPISDRSFPEFENLIGMFANTLVLRTDFWPGQTVRQLIHQVREAVLDAHAHADMPFEKLVEVLRPDRTLSRSPLFQVAFVHESRQGNLSYSGISSGSMFELTFYALEQGDGSIEWLLEYSTDLFDRDTIARFSNHYLQLVKAFLAAPHERIVDLPLITGVERKQLLQDWGADPSDYPRASTVDQLYREQAAATPDKVAVIEQDFDGNPRSLTYGELETQSDQLARALLALGAGPTSYVAVALDRSADAIVSFLAVLKTGAAFVPLDPTFPKQRIEFILGNIQAPILLTHSRHVRKLPDFAGSVICVDESRELLFTSDSTPVISQAVPESAAYVMYTSGSTGEPKGVCVAHRGIVRLVKNTNYIDLSADDVILACAPMTFDASTFEIWGSLLNGGRLVLFPDRIPTPDSLARSIAAHNVTTLWLTAGLFQQIADAAPSTFKDLKYLLAGGDVLSLPHVNRVLAVLDSSSYLINGYGPTENTTFTCCHRMPGGSRLERPVPIGRPISNTTVYILGDEMELIPAGAVGHLYTGGDGIAQGYLKQDSLTEERFVPDPFQPHDPHAKLYRTGDLARYLSDGTIEFIGRNDNQIKVRGFRIEPGEIEAAVSTHPAVQECAVKAIEDGNGGKYLACYLVVGHKEESFEAELRGHLTQTLPDYMIPSAYVFLPSLPLSENGKVNRKALPEPTHSESKKVAPRNAKEAELLHMWEEALGRKGIGVTDSFFNIGGHSLLAVKLFSRIEKVYGAAPISLLFEAPTVEQMAIRLNDKKAGCNLWRSLVCIQPAGTRPPLFLVPGVGGNVLGFAPLAEALGLDQPVYGLQSAGLDGSQAPFDQVEDIAANFLSEIRSVQPSGPYFLGGACMGGTVAYEIAQQLRAGGETVDLLALIDTYIPRAQEGNAVSNSSLVRTGQLIGGRVMERLRTLARLKGKERRDFIKEKLGILFNIAKNGVETYDNSELHRDRVTQANQRAYFRYVPARYDGTLFLVLARHREVPSEIDPRLAWSALVTGDCTVHHVFGKDSGDLLKSPRVERIAEYLSEAMRASVFVAMGFGCV
jgi:amino acid adenylation domain-containing protein